MKNGLIVLLLLGLVVGSVHSIDMSNYTQNQNSSTVSFFQGIQNDLYSQFKISGGSDFESFVQENTLVVLGSGTSPLENSVFQTAISQAPEMNNLTQTTDNISNIENENSSLLILLGGPSQNRVARQVELLGWMTDNITDGSGLILNEGKSPTGSDIIIVSDARGYENAARASAALSPLASFVPLQDIPAAATGISILLLVVINLSKTILEFKASDIGRSGKEVGEGAWKVFGINMIEILALIAAALILGISITYQYFGISSDFWVWISTATGICLIGAIIHELAHRVVAIVFKIKVEYKFWPAGAALTLVSTYLGNAFSIQGFLLEEIPENIAKWKVGLMKLAGPIASTVVMVVFAALNYVKPSIIYQIIYSTSALWAMAEMFPFRGLDGKDIKEWSTTIWLGAFVIIGALYIFVMFIL